MVIGISQIPGQKIIAPEVALVSAVLVFAAIVTSLFLDRRSSPTLVDAKNALDAAIDEKIEFEEVQQKFEKIEDAYQNEIDRLSHLQAAREAIRVMLDDVAVSARDVADIELIERILVTVRRSLIIALGFESKHLYTIGVYEWNRKSALEASQLELRAHVRSIDCDITKAHKWKYGEGAAGEALAGNREVIYPDLTSPELGSQSEQGAGPKNDIRYRAIVAKPIMINQTEIWGMFCATSDQPGHFSTTNRAYVDVACSIAGMIGLALRINRLKRRIPRPTSATAAASPSP